MPKILGSWGGMRRYLEQEMLAPRLRGRVRYGCTTYVGMDGCRIFTLALDGKVVRRFSWETVNSWLLAAGKKGPSATQAGIAGYWEGFWQGLEAVPPAKRPVHTDGEFCEALARYRSQPIAASLASSDRLVEAVARALTPTQTRMTLLLPYDRAGLLAEVRRDGKVFSEEYLPEGIRADALVDEKVAHLVARYREQAE